MQFFFVWVWWRDYDAGRQAEWRGPPCLSEGEGISIRVLRGEDRFALLAICVLVREEPFFVPAVRRPDLP